MQKTRRGKDKLAKLASDVANRKPVLRRHIIGNLLIAIVIKEKTKMGAEGRYIVFLLALDISPEEVPIDLSNKETAMQVCKPLLCPEKLNVDEFDFYEAVVFEENVYIQ